MGITLLLEANRLLLSNRGKNFHGNLCSIKSSQLVGSVKAKSFMNFQGNLCGVVSCQLVGSFKVQSLMALTRSSVDRHSPQSTQLVHTERSQKQKPLREWLKYLAVLVVQSLSLLMLMHFRNSALAFSGNHVISSSAAPSLHESSPFLPRPEQRPEVLCRYCRKDQNLPEGAHNDLCSKHVLIYVTLIMFGLMLGMTDGGDPRGTVIKFQTASKLKNPPNTFIKIKVGLLYLDDIFENDLNRILKKAPSLRGEVFMLKEVIDCLHTQMGYWEEHNSLIKVSECKEDAEKQLKELFDREQSNTFCSYKRSRSPVVTILVAAAECEGQLDLSNPSYKRKMLDMALKQLQSFCSTGKIHEARVLFSPRFEMLASNVWIGGWVSVFLKQIAKLRGLIENLYVGDGKERTDSISGKAVETGMSKTTSLNVEKQKSDVVWQTKTIIISMTRDGFDVINETIKDVKDNLIEFFKNSLEESPLCFCFISNISKRSGYTVELELNYGLDKNQGLEELCIIHDEITNRILGLVKEAGETNEVQIQ